MLNHSSTDGLYAETIGRDTADGPRQVLVVGDDPLQSKLLSHRLSGNGYSVTTAHSDAEACELAQRRRFPVVVVDCNVRDANDVQLLCRLREQQANRSYLIARSVLGTSGERECSLLYGADDHVSKLLSTAELLKHIATGFDVMAKRDSQRVARLMRSCGAVLGRDLDTEEWKFSATRLHTEMLHAARDKKPLSVFVVHLERQLMPGEKPLLTLTQFVQFTSALDSILKLNSDFALPLDASDGLVRLLVVLHETNLQDAVTIRNRLRATLVKSSAGEANATIADESGVFPDCAIGLAAVESWDTTTVTNVHELLALAEQSMEKLTLPA